MAQLSRLALESERAILLTMKSLALFTLLVATGCWTSSLPGGASRDGGPSDAPDVSTSPDVWDGPDGWDLPDVWAGPDGGPDVWFWPDGGPDVWGSPDVWTGPDGGPDVWSGPDGGPDGWGLPDVWTGPDGGPDVWSGPDGGSDVWDLPDGGPDADLECSIPELIELTGAPGNSSLCSLVAFRCELTRVGANTVRFACDGTTGACRLTNECSCDGTFNAGGFSGTSSFDFERRRFRGSAAGVSCEWSFESR